MNDANRKSVKILRGLLLCTGILTLLYSAAMCFVINFNVGIILIGLVGLCLIVAGVFLRALVNAIFNKLRWVLVFPAVAVAMVALQITVISLYAACDDADYTEDAVIVLGAGIDGDKITRQLALRLDAAVEYHSANPDALIVVSGGMGPEEWVTEAFAMEQYLLSKGVPQANIIKEEASSSTYSNFSNSKRLLDEYFEERGSADDYTVVVITNSYHALRACMTAEKVGLDCRHVAAATPWYEAPVRYLRECLALIKYLLS